MLMTISVTIIAALFLVLTTAMVIALWQIRRAAKEAGRLMEMARQHIAPLAHDATLILADVRSITQSAQKGAAKVEESVTVLRDTAERLRSFEETLEKRIGPPIVETVSFLSALLAGIRTFWRYLTHR